MIAAHPTLRGAYRLTSEFWTSLPLDQVFEFFADAHNLEELTPAFLHFRVQTPAPIPMQLGTLIDYRLSLHGFPMKWRSLISAWDPPYRFIDEQVIGPYSFWHHEHTFESVQEGTLIRDVVDYSVPGGRLIHAMFVRPDLLRIFQFRREQMRKRFPENSIENHLTSGRPDRATPPGLIPRQSMEGGE